MCFELWALPRLSKRTAECRRMKIRTKLLSSRLKRVDRNCLFRQGFGSRLYSVASNLSPYIYISRAANWRFAYWNVPVQTHASLHPYDTYLQIDTRACVCNLCIVRACVRKKAPTVHEMTLLFSNICLPSFQILSNSFICIGANGLSETPARNPVAVGA